MAALKPSISTIDATKVTEREAAKAKLFAEIEGD
jgi:hypothetical protein